MRHLIGRQQHATAPQALSRAPACRPCARAGSLSRAGALVWLLAAVLGSALGQEAIPAQEALQLQYTHQILPLLTTYCIDCHDADAKSKTPVRLDLLRPDILPGNIEAWTHVKNMLDVGNMPPKGKDRPSRAELDALLTWIGGSLRRYDAIHKETGGDTLIRRINNRAYANMMKSLLGVPAQGMESFPDDGAVHGFDTVGAGLYTTTYLYDLYLASAKKTLDLAISKSDHAPAVAEWRHRFTEAPGHIYDANRAALRASLADLRQDPASFLANDLRGISSALVFNMPDVPASLLPLVRRSLVNDVVTAHYNAPSIEAVEAQGIDWVRDPACVSELASALEVQIGNLQRLEQYITQFKYVTVGAFDGAPVGYLAPGYYDVSARLCLGNASHPLPVGIMAGDRFISESMLYDPQEAPQVHTVRVYWDPRWTRLAAQGLLPYSGDINSKTVSFATGYLMNWIAATYTLSHAEASIMGSAWSIQGHDWDHVPASSATGKARIVPTGILCSDLCIRGPLNDAWPPPAEARILTRGLTAPPSREYAEEIVSNFMKRAYVVGSCDAEMTKPYVDMIMDYFDSSKDFVEAIKFGLGAILSSPQFLYLGEHQRADPASRRPLGPFELARRLAYFLWSDLPDDQLLASAASGRLTDPAELLAQTRRMIADRRSRAFREAFTTQWLKIDKVPKIAFLNDQFPGFDIYLQQSAMEESFAFFSEILDKNLSVLDFIDSDFLMLNGRMALHYGIPGVVGNEFRRVNCPPGSHRGGVLTQASVLMAGSNGMVGSLVRRGALILDRLLGDPPGVPPPDVPALDKVPTANPDGSPFTPIERLSMHRANQSCARCHDRIDPLGSGLENFNALGAYSTTIKILLASVSKKTHTMWEERTADVRGTLPDGAAFDGPDGLKRRLAEHKDAFVRTMAECMLIYALGRDLEQSDRPVLDALCASVAQHGYGLATMVEQTRRQ